jgi:hypothetical protein
MTALDETTVLDLPTSIYNFGNYNSLTHIHEAMKWDIQNTAIELLKIIKEADAFDLVGVCRLHRHF